jgi:hypothetical protein
MIDTDTDYAIFMFPQYTDLIAEGIYQTRLVIFV